jgi:putative endonuclease
MTLPGLTWIETWITTWIDAQEWGLGQLDGLAARVRRGAPMAPHLATGLRGERDALFHLRRNGYTIVARRWTSAKVRGDIDLIAWQDDRLCFVEVKTRTVRDNTPAESAVDEDKRTMIRRLARIYLHSFPEKERRTIPVRFDVISVYRIQGGSEFEIFPAAFGWR